MSTGSAPIPLRTAFHEELDQLRLQVELMGVRVDQNLERMRQVLDHGDVTGDLVAAARSDGAFGRCVQTVKFRHSANAALGRPKGYWRVRMARTEG